MAADGVIREKYGVTFTAGKLNVTQLDLPSAVDLVEERVVNEIPSDLWSRFES